MELRSLVRPELIYPGITAPDRRSVLAEVSRKLAESGRVGDPSRLLAKLVEREELGSTALGSGVAIPHCKLRGLSDVFMVVATVPGGVDFEAPDEEPVRLLFVVVSPESSPAAHLQCLAAISKSIQSVSLDDLVQEDDPEEIARLLGGGTDAPEEGGETVAQGTSDGATDGS